MTLVLAADPADYHLWRTGEGKGKISHFVSGPEQLYGWGLVNVEILCIPLWWTEDDQLKLEEIMERSK